MANNEFSPKDPGETVLCTFDYTQSLGVGENILSAIISVLLRVGADDDPSAMIDGSVIISTPRVGQLITGGILGNVYHITCTATTSGDQVLILTSPMTIVNAH